MWDPPDMHTYGVPGIDCTAVVHLMHQNIARKYLAGCLVKGGYSKHTEVEDWHLWAHRQGHELNALQEEKYVTEFRSWIEGGLEGTWPYGDGIAKQGLSESESETI